MSTRAVYTFMSHGESHAVYVHHDGYPTGAADKFKAALQPGLAWKLPRFESDEFAAAFVAANKDGPGGVRLTDSHESHGDLEWCYFVSMVDSALVVSVTGPDGESDTIWHGLLSEFIESKAAEIEDME